MLYIEGSKMDWTVNDSLYHRFLKWKLKCEHILKHELAMLPESKKCKEVIVWSGDFGMDQYVSWCLPAEYICLDTVWAKYEDFASHKPMKSGSDLTCLQASDRGNHSVDEWYNAVQAQVSLAKYPPENSSVSCTETYSVFLLKDEKFVLKTINDSNIDFEKFPASKVRQLAKRMGSMKSTAHNIKQVASDCQAAQVNLMRHQRTDLPPNKSKQKQQSFKSRSKSHKRYSSEHTIIKGHSTRRDLILTKLIKEKIDVQSVVIQSIQKVSSVLQGSSSARQAIYMVILQVCATRRKYLLSLEHP